LVQAAPNSAEWETGMLVAPPPVVVAPEKVKAEMKRPREQTLRHPASPTTCATCGQ